MVKMTTEKKTMQLNMARNKKITTTILNARRNRSHILSLSRMITLRAVASLIMKRRTTATREMAATRATKTVNTIVNKLTNETRITMLQPIRVTIKVAVVEAVPEVAILASTTMLLVRDRTITMTMVNLLEDVAEEELILLVNMPLHTKNINNKSRQLEKKNPMLIIKAETRMMILAIAIIKIISTPHRESQRRPLIS